MTTESQGTETPSIRKGVSSEKGDLQPSASFDSKEEHPKVLKTNSFDSVQSQEKREANGGRTNQHDPQKSVNGENNGQSVIDYMGQTAKKPIGVTGGKPPRNPTPPRDMRQQNAARQLISQHNQQQQQQPQQQQQQQQTQSHQNWQNQGAQPQAVQPQNQLHPNQQTHQGQQQQIQPQPQPQSQPQGQGQAPQNGRQHFQQTQNGSQHIQNPQQQMQHSQQNIAHQNQPQQAQQTQSTQNLPQSQIAQQQPQYAQQMQSAQNGQQIQSTQNQGQFAAQTQQPGVGQSSQQSQPAQPQQQQQYMQQQPQQQQHQQPMNHQQGQAAPAQYSADPNQQYQNQVPPQNLQQQESQSYSTQSQQQQGYANMQQQPAPPPQQQQQQQGLVPQQYHHQQQPQFPQQQPIQPQQVGNSQQDQQQLPQLALATDQQQLRKQLDDQAKLQQQHEPQRGFQPLAQTAQIVGMVGTTPIVKIQGTAGHVVKKKKGRFNLLEGAPGNGTAAAPTALPSGPAHAEAGGAGVPAVVVANRERSLSNGSTMSQITSVTHAKPPTIDVPVVKKKGRFLVTKVPAKSPGMIAVQVAQTNPPPKADTVHQQPQQSSLPPIAGSPSHKKTDSSDQSVQGNQAGAGMQPSIAPSPAQDPQQQLLQTGNGEVLMQPRQLIQPQQQVLLQDNAIPVQVLPAQTVSHHGLYPSQMIQATAAQTPYTTVGAAIPQQMLTEVLPNNGIPPSAVPFDPTTPQSQQPLQSGAGPPMVPQHLLYTPVEVQQQLPVQQMQIQPQQHPPQMQQQPQLQQTQHPPPQQTSQQQPPQQPVQQPASQQTSQQPPSQQPVQQPAPQHQQPQQPPPQQQSHQQVAPATPPPAVVSSSVGTNLSPTPEPRTPVPVVLMNPLPLKQGQATCEDAAAVPPKVPKQPQPVAPVQAQPPRNKPRNLVAARNATGYGNGQGLGKVFYFLDQMRNEVTDADRTIKTLQKDMKFMREKNKELEARNRELERRLREEQALRESAQAKLKALKKKGRDERTVGEGEEENGSQRNLRKARLNDSPEKGTASAAEAKMLSNGVKGKPAGEALSAMAPKQSSTANPANRQARDASPLPGAAKPMTKVESTMGERNSSGMDTKKSSNAIPPNPTKQANGIKTNQPAAKQVTNEKIDNKGGNKPMGQGQLVAPNTPNTVKTQTVNVAADKFLSQSHGAGQNVQENAARAGPGNGSSNVARASAMPAPSDPKSGNKPATQRPANGGPKIPSAIEFDPLKSATPNEVNMSLDANGRNTPVDTQSVSSGANNAGFTSADVGLGGNTGYAIHNQYSQPFDVAAGFLGHSQMAVPVVGIAPAAGLMGYQQTNGAYQGATMMQVTQQPFSQPTSETQNGGMSLLQQPFLQVSDQTSLHSVPVADLSQPMILIRPQECHIRGVSMHDFSPEAIALNAPHHSRANSLHTLQNMTPSWNQNSQWASMPSNSMVQQQQQQQYPPQQLIPPSDPFDELVSRRPMSTMSGK